MLFFSHSFAFDSNFSFIFFSVKLSSTSHPDQIPVHPMTMMISGTLNFDHTVKVLKHLEKKVGGKALLFEKGIPYAEGHILCSSSNYVLIMPSTARPIALSEFEAYFGTNDFIQKSLVVAYQMVRVISQI